MQDTAKVQKERIFPWIGGEILGRRAGRTADVMMSDVMSWCFYCFYHSANRDMSLAALYVNTSFRILS